MSSDPGASVARWNPIAPTVLIFDVNETLIDIESMAPLFERVFGDAAVLREWFGQVITYSMTLTLAGLYQDFFALGAGVFRMVGDIHGLAIDDADVAALADGMRTMPAHPDVHAGLAALRDKGFRLVTLTNSPPSPDGRSPLERAGLAGYFERQFSVETARSYKPAGLVYHLVADALGVAPQSCCLVAAHVWDTIGAQAAGMSSALITRPGNALLPVPGLPQPNVVAPDVTSLAKALTNTLPQ